jgi:hypothetical protein
VSGQTQGSGQGMSDEAASVGRVILDLTRWMRREDGRTATVMDYGLRRVRMYGKRHPGRQSTRRGSIVIAGRLGTWHGKSRKVPRSMERKDRSVR